MATPAKSKTTSSARSAAGHTAGSDRGRAHLVLIGCNHRTAPVELRERVAFTQEQALHAAAELRRQRILDEAVVVSTCNRSELYGVADTSVAPTTEALEEFLTSYHGISRAEIDGRIYHWTGTDALRHLFRVAAGLDSMLLGEAEILGQLRAAYGQALENGSTGPLLNRAFQGALEVGKRVRSETEVGARPMSVAFAGVKLAERVFGNLKGRAALVVGAGAVAEQVVEHLRNRGIRSLRVANRSFDRAAELAATMGGEAVAWDALESVLAAPDIIVSSVGNVGPVLTRDTLERAIAARGGRPIFLVDLGIPRNVAPDAAGLYNLYLYNIDDLGEIVEQNKRAREAEIPRAEAIISEHVEKFEGWRAGMEAASIVEDLRGQFHQQREAFLRARLAEMQEASPAERERLAALTQDLIEHLLREPADRLRSGRGLRGRLAAIDAVRDLFGLDTASRAAPPGPKSEDRE
ncbi:MAG TPA: glutamyl-tRNA reductase [Candidatus Aquilonibacter sp.]|nr:glutamyl-tRNA reductase [Candidatus Aquilonibacter sp.]